MAEEEKTNEVKPEAGQPEAKAEETPPAESRPAEEVKPAAEEAKKPAAEEAKKPADAGDAEKPAADGEKDESGDVSLSLEADVPAPIKRRGKSGKHVPVGIVFIKATFNTTQVTITDANGNVVAWGSSGRSGFKGSRKSTAFAATVVSQDAARQAVSMGMQEVEVRVQGPGAGRESAIRALQSVGLSVSSIKDVTPIPHNGCRPPKRRRV